MGRVKTHIRSLHAIAIGVKIPLKDLTQSYKSDIRLIPGQSCRDTAGAEHHNGAELIRPLGDMPQPLYQETRIVAGFQPDTHLGKIAAHLIIGLTKLIRGQARISRRRRHRVSGLMILCATMHYVWEV